MQAQSRLHGAPLVPAPAAQETGPVTMAAALRNPRHDLGEAIMAWLESLSPVTVRRGVLVICLLFWALVGAALVHIF